MDVLYSPYFGMSDEVQGFVVTARDITEHYQANDALRKSEAQLLTLIKTLPDLVWLKDPDGIYLSCNPKFERLYGATKSQIIGKTDAGCAIYQ